MGPPKPDIGPIPIGPPMPIGGPVLFNPGMLTKKSKISVFIVAASTSSFCRALRLHFSAAPEYCVLFHLFWHQKVEILPQERMLSSSTNISQAFANNTGASAEIILTSSSLFIILLILAKGRSL
jgi:hypothetical protein